jgi:small nuclear ribonucleoprotein (snRNP)-like protein
MNIALEKTEEFVNGVFKNRYGDVFIRGNNGTCWQWLGSSNIEANFYL